MGHANLVASFPPCTLSTWLLGHNKGSDVTPETDDADLHGVEENSLCPCIRASIRCGQLNMDQYGYCTHDGYGRM